MSERRCRSGPAVSPARVPCCCRTGPADARSCRRPSPRRWVRWRRCTGETSGSRSRRGSPAHPATSSRSIRARRACPARRRGAGGRRTASSRRNAAVVAPKARPRRESLPGSRCDVSSAVATRTRDPRTPSAATASRADRVSSPSPASTPPACSRAARTGYTATLCVLCQPAPYEAAVLPGDPHRRDADAAYHEKTMNPFANRRHITPPARQWSGPLGTHARPE